MDWVSTPSFLVPRDVDIDPDGNLIISDSLNNRLRQLTRDGVITTIAGGYSSSGGNIGDGGPLQYATLLDPTGVAFSADGVMYIRESTRLRRVDHDTITTLASGFIASGDIAVGSAGDVYVPDGNVIWRVDTLGQKTLFAGVLGGGGSAADGVAASNAVLDGVYHVAIAPNDDVYFSDFNSGRVRKVANGIVTTVAGGGTVRDATGCMPATRPVRVPAQGLAFSPEGDLVIAAAKLVRKVALTDRPCPSMSAITPKRVLETRVAEGQIGFTGPKPQSGQVVTVHLGVAGSVVPADATAVALNITVTNATVNGYVTAWPCEAERPRASNVNVVVGQTAANSAVIALGDSNDVCLFDHAGGDLIVDVTGYIGSTTPYQPLVPYRALETRPAEGQFHYIGNKPVAGQIVRLPVTGWGFGSSRTVSPFASAVVFNVTATNATADGYITVWSCAEPRPTASNLNVTLGGTVAHLVISSLSEGSVCLYTQSGADLVVDILGAFAAESPYVGTTPSRVLETRVADGQIGYQGGTPAAGQTVEVDVLHSNLSVVAQTARAVVINVTATNPAAPGFVTVWPCGTPRPVSSSLNLSASDTQSNAIVVGLGAAGKVCIYTQSGTDLIADVNGIFA